MAMHKHYLGDGSSYISEMEVCPPGVMHDPPKTYPRIAVLRAERKRLYRMVQALVNSVEIDTDGSFIGLSPSYETFTAARDLLVELQYETQ